MCSEKRLTAAILLALLCTHAIAAPPPKAPARPVAKAPVRPASPAVDTVAILHQGVSALQQGQKAKAEQLFKQALAKMGPADPNLIIPYQALSRIYYEQQQYQQALTYAQKYLPHAVKRHGASSVGEADVHYLIALIQSGLNDRAAAEASYKRAIAIYELPQNAGRQSFDYSAALHNLGVMAAQNKQYEAAIPFYQKALSVQPPGQQKESALILENLGAAYQNQNKPEEAANYYQQALALYEKSVGSDAPETKRTAFRLANIRGSMTATATGTPAENTTSTPVASNSNRYDGRFYEAGKKAYNEEKNYAEAAIQFKLALEQALKFYPNEKSFIAMLQAALGKALYFSESDEAAEPYLEQALAYQSKNTAANDADLLNTHTFLGLAYNRKAEYPLAEKHFQYVIAHTAKESSEYRTTLPILAENLCHQGRFDEARNLYQQALAYYQQQATPDAQQVKTIQYQLALLEKMFRSRAQGLEQYFNYSVNGLHRWNDENESIRILVTSGQSLTGWNGQQQALVQKAFQEWQNALGSQVKFQFTSDPDKTDVVVYWTDKPISETDVDAQVGIHKLESMRGFFTKSDIVLVLAKNGKPRSEQDIYATALHEIGHMLGLSHSVNLADIMAEVGNYSHSGKAWPTLSARDIQAARTLYQQKPSVTNPKHITLAEYRQFNAIATEGITALQRHNYGEALRTFKEARSVYTGDPFINFYCGLSAFQKGEYKEARDIFEDLVMPESATKAFSVDSQLGLIYVELGHKYNKWGKKNKAISAEFYEKGVHHLGIALRSPELTPNQRDYFLTKYHEGQRRQRPEPVIYFDTRFPSGRFF